MAEGIVMDRTGMTTRAPELIIADWRRMEAELEGRDPDPATRSPEEP